MNRKSPILIIAATENQRLYQDFPLPGEELIVIPYGQAVCSMIFRSIDLVLLDCGYETQLGLHLLEDLKQRFPEVPVLFIADQSSEELVLNAFRKGSRDFIRKPFKTFLLREQVAELLKAKRSAREIRGRLPVAGDLDHTSGNLCDVNDGMSPAIMKTVCYVENNYSKKISLYEMAELANMSKYHFTRVFQRQIGMSPVAYLKFVRVQRAKEFLKQADLTISSTAMLVGFHDVSNFCKNFKKYEGVSPSAFRSVLPYFV